MIILECFAPASPGKSVYGQVVCIWKTAHSSFVQGAMSEVQHLSWMLLRPRENTGLCTWYEAQFLYCAEKIILIFDLWITFVNLLAAYSNEKPGSCSRKNSMSCTADSLKEQFINKLTNVNCQIFGPLHVLKRISNFTEPQYSLIFFSFEPEIVLKSSLIAKGVAWSQNQRKILKFLLMSSLQRWNRIINIVLIVQKSIYKQYHNTRIHQNSKSSCSLSLALFLNFSDSEP